MTARVALLLALAWAIPTVWLVGRAYDQIITDGQSLTRIEEDSPQWDCRTMGNRVCGNGVNYAP